MAKETFPMCNGGPKVPSQEELEILGLQRELKSKIRALKAELGRSPDLGRRQDLEDQLDSLRLQWSDLERKKEEARARRMKLLGYQD